MQNSPEELGSSAKKNGIQTKHSQSSKGTTNPMVASFRLIGILAKYHFLIICYYSMTDFTLFTQIDVQLLPKKTNKGRGF